MTADQASVTLPAGFTDLEPLVPYWGKPTSQERWDQRSAASMEQIRDFYDRMLERSDAILAHLDPFDLDALPEPEARLFCLMLSLANCAMAVELHGAPRAPYSPFPHGVRILQGAAPLG